MSLESPYGDTKTNVVSVYPGHFWLQVLTLFYTLYPPPLPYFHNGVYRHRVILFGVECGMIISFSVVFCFFLQAFNENALQFMFGFSC